MTEPYSLRTLVAPEVRWYTVYAIVCLALAGITGALGTVKGSGFAILSALVALAGGMAVLSIVDEKAKEIESEA